MELLWKSRITRQCKFSLNFSSSFIRLLIFQLTVYPSLPKLKADTGSPVLASQLFFRVNQQMTIPLSVSPSLSFLFISILIKVNYFLRSKVTKREILNSLLHSQMVAVDRVRLVWSQQLQLGLPLWVQGPQEWAILCCLSRHISWITSGTAGTSICAYMGCRDCRQHLYLLHGASSQVK